MRISKTLIAELRRPEGKRERSPRSIEIVEKEKKIKKQKKKQKTRIEIMKSLRFVFHSQHG